MLTRLTVQVLDTAFPKTFAVPLNKRVILGRSDVDHPTMRPDVDFISCNAIRNGISRQHAALSINEGNRPMIYDLGSRNGTVVNGEVLSPHQPHPLKDGDKIHFGKLHVTVFFDRE
jgi:pSer/pThr/pTyr-binding forkhead associated (FHA) protein